MEILRSGDSDLSCVGDSWIIGRRRPRVCLWWLFRRIVLDPCGVLVASDCIGAARNRVIGGCVVVYWWSVGVLAHRSCCGSAFGGVEQRLVCIGNRRHAFVVSVH